MCQRCPQKGGRRNFQYNFEYLATLCLALSQGSFSCKTCLRCSLSSRSVRLCSQAQSYKPHELSFDWIRTFSRCMFILLLCTSCTSLSSMNHSCDADFLPCNRHVHESHLRNRSSHKDGIDTTHFPEPCTSHENAPQQMRMLSAPLFDAHLTRKEQQAPPSNAKMCRYHRHTAILDAILEP